MILPFVLWNAHLESLPFYSLVCYTPFSVEQGLSNSFDHYAHFPSQPERDRCACASNTEVVRNKTYAYHEMFSNISFHIRVLKVLSNSHTIHIMTHNFQNHRPRRWGKKNLINIFACFKHRLLKIHLFVFKHMSDLPWGWLTTHHTLFSLGVPSWLGWMAEMERTFRIQASAANTRDLYFCPFTHLVIPWPLHTCTHTRNETEFHQVEKGLQERRK